jgi:hypothetical protein
MSANALFEIPNVNTTKSTSTNRRFIDTPPYKENSNPFVEKQSNFNAISLTN